MTRLLPDAGVLERLRGSRALDWAVPAGLVAVAAFTRLWNLGHPGRLVFDETYYVKDGWSLFKLGYSSTWPEDADDSFASGVIPEFGDGGSYVVHPPAAKWLIGLGMQLFGPGDPASWRVATAVVGILSVVLLYFIARRLFSSTLLGGIAGFLFAIDGNAIVMSRVALLDNFVMFFALLGFGALLLDREYASRRLDARFARSPANGPSGGPGGAVSPTSAWGPVLWWRPWLLAAGVTLGLASAVKWSGFYFLAAFAIYSLAVDVLAHRRAGVAFWPGTIWRQGPVTFLTMIPIALGVHLATWAGWFGSEGGYGRQWAEQAGNAWSGILPWVPLSFQSWWHYQAGVYAYHVGEVRPHGYQANPLSWLLMTRPTSMYYDDAALGESGCTVNYCGSLVTGLANPLIWWAAGAAMLYLIYRLVRYRDWRVGFILTGVAAGYLPWLLYLNRTVFQFYTIAFEPYLILALTFVLGMLLTEPSAWRRASGERFVIVFLALAVAFSIFFWPLWTGTQLDYNFLRAHWWLPGWV